MNVDVFVLKCAHWAMVMRDMAHNGFIGGSYIYDSMSNNPPINSDEDANFRH